MLKIKKINILVIILAIFCSVLIGCGEKELSEPDVYGISATSDNMQKMLKKIVLDYSYKRLTRNLLLPEKANGEYVIEWSVSENKYATIEKKGEDSILKITRHDTEFIEFELIAKIYDEETDDYGQRVWVCYITPKVYR